MYDALSEAAIMTTQLNPREIKAVKPPVEKPSNKFRVWWIPQLGMKKSFLVYVDTLEKAALLLNVLADYDKFQLDNRVKGDYANAGGVCVWDKEQMKEDSSNPEIKENDWGWSDWCDEETGDNLDDLLRDNNGILPERLRK